MTETPLQLVERIHRESLTRLREQTQAPIAPGAGALPPDVPNSPVAEEWTLFCRELPRLLNEGHRGRYALVKAGHDVTVWDTLRDAIHAGDLLYGTTLCLVQPVAASLPSFRVGYNKLCRD